MKNEIPITSLPPDILRIVKRQSRYSTVWSSLWYAVWAVSIALYYLRDSSVRPHWTLLIFSVVLLLLPLKIFHLHTTLFDRVWSGEIVRVKYKMMSDIPVFSEGLERVERHETAILYIRRADGKTRRIACRRLWRAADRCYRIGDTVRHIPFIRLPQNLTYTPPDEKMCVVCGTVSPHSGETCAACGRTIL